MRRFIIPTKVCKVHEKKRASRSYKTGRKLEDGKDEIAVEYENLGWFVQLEGMTDSISIGPEPTDIEIGQAARIVIEVT
jgi:hypothetical protein